MKRIASAGLHGRPRPERGPHAKGEPGDGGPPVHDRQVADQNAERDSPERCRLHRQEGRYEAQPARMISTAPMRTSSAAAMQWKCASSARKCTHTSRPAARSPLAPSRASGAGPPALSAAPRGEGGREGWAQRRRGRWRAGPPVRTPAQTGGRRGRERARTAPSPWDLRAAGARTASSGCPSIMAATPAGRPCEPGRPPAPTRLLQAAGHVRGKRLDLGVRELALEGGHLSLAVLDDLGGVGGGDLARG